MKKQPNNLCVNCKYLKGYQPDDGLACNYWCACYKEEVSPVFGVRLVLRSEFLDACKTRSEECQGRWFEPTLSARFKCWLRSLFR